MNTSITYNDLSEIEREIADLYVYGYTKKEIAIHRNRSYYTINNQIDKLFKKTEVRKDTEFSRWYYHARFRVSFDLSPIKRIAITICLLTLISVSTFSGSIYTVRIQRAGRYSRSIQTLRRVRRNDECFVYEILS